MPLRSNTLVQRSRRAWLLVVLLVSSPGLGCSLLMVNPPKVQGFVNPGCTRSRGLPTADVVIALLQVLRTGIALAASDDLYKNSPLSRGADIGIGLGATALFGGSAVYGFSAIDECLALEEEPVRPRRRPPPPRQRYLDPPADPAETPPPYAPPEGDAGAPATDGGASDVVPAAPPAPPVVPRRVRQISDPDD